MKLYKVNLRGLGGGSGVNYKSSYVVAENADKAYLTVRSHLDEKDYGFTRDREMESVELLAEDSDYAESLVRLFLPNHK